MPKTRVSLSPERRVSHAKKQRTASGSVVPVNADLWVTGAVVASYWLGRIVQWKKDVDRGIGPRQGGRK
jgi:hypothetical protein